MCVVPISVSFWDQCHTPLTCIVHIGGRIYEYHKLVPLVAQLAWGSLWRCCCIFNSIVPSILYFPLYAGVYVIVIYLYIHSGCGEVRTGMCAVCVWEPYMLTHRRIDVFRLGAVQTTHPRLHHACIQWSRGMPTMPWTDHGGVCNTISQFRLHIPDFITPTIMSCDMPITHRADHDSGCGHHCLPVLAFVPLVSLDPCS